MEDADKQRDVPLTEDREGPLADKGWHAGATFFAENGGAAARPPEQGEETGQESGGEDPHLPASDSADAGSGAGGTHRPASETDSAPHGDDRGGETQSWPGASFGSIPPPG